MKSLKEHRLESAVQYHLENNVPFTDNVFRPLTEMSNLLFQEAKILYENGDYIAQDWFESELLESDIGTFDLFEGETVPLDFPLYEEDEKDPELNKPKRGGSKKYYVYVRNDKGNVVKVQFGDTTGLTAKINNPEARKSFVARHKCSEKTDKTSPGYWACRLPHFSSSVGLQGGGNFFW